MGFSEVSPENVRKNIELQGNSIKSLMNGKTYQFGVLETPTLSALRNKSQNNFKQNGRLTLSEMIGDVQLFHKMDGNNNALFQAASQFNLLEMVNPNMIPEDGIGIYELDKTQGPACAIACGAGTIYRNYFAEVNGLIGQTANNQINCLEEIAQYFENDKHQYWELKNGYALATKEGLLQISKKLQNLDKKEYETLKGLLKVGIQWDTEVTISPNKQIVSQIYCSALPVAYSFVDAALWKDFACLILEATYEATLHAALINSAKTGNNKVWLTLVGGGAFGNKADWIIDAILKSLQQFSKEALDVTFISFRAANPIVEAILKRYKESE